MWFCDVPQGVYVALDLQLDTQDSLRQTHMLHFIHTFIALPENFNNLLFDE